MAEGKECTNCDELVLDDGDGRPECKAGCDDFKKQLCSGQTIDCKSWKVKQ